MRNRKQNGQIVRIGDRWYVRYWERRNIGGTVERKRVTHHLGSVETRGKRPPADIEKEAERHMATVNGGAIPADRIVTIGDFVERVYLPWIEQHKRPSTAKGYRNIWEDHLKPYCQRVWLKDTRTYHVQGWLDEIGKRSLSRNTLKHIKSVVSAIFTLQNSRTISMRRTPPAIQQSILGLLSLKKRMPIHSMRSRASSLSSPSPQGPPLQSLRSWGCDMARFAGCCGRTTATERCTSPDQFGMAGLQIPRPARGARRFQ